MGQFTCLAHLVVLYLIQVHSLGELVSLTEDNHGHFVLASQVGDHRGAHLCDTSAISENITRPNKHFRGPRDQGRDPLDQRVDAFNAARAQSFDEGAPRETWARIHHDHRNVETLLVCLLEEIFEHVAGADHHDGVTSLL